MHKATSLAIYWSSQTVSNQKHKFLKVFTFFSWIKYFNTNTSLKHCCENTCFSVSILAAAQRCLYIPFRLHWTSEKEIRNHHIKMTHHYDVNVSAGFRVVPEKKTPSWADNTFRTFKITLPFFTWWTWIELFLLFQRLKETNSETFHQTKSGNFCVFVRVWVSVSISGSGCCNYNYVSVGTWHW